jgi:GNAT superfamily N-acetyltransferase
LRLHGAISSPELDEIAEVAMLAFFDDPFFVFLSPGDGLRRRGLRIFFRSFVKHIGEGRTIYVAKDQDQVVGVACWASPGSYPAPMKDQLLQSIQAFWALFLRPKALIDGLRYIAAIDKAHPKAELWYLGLLAVRPSHQRQGIGSLLLAPVLEEADAQGHDAYLETQKEDNLAYYRRVSFDVSSTLHPVPTGPPLWTMRRKAKVN